MKITAKFAALSAAALLASAVASAQGTDDYGLPQGFRFYNEIGSDTIKVVGNIKGSTKDGGKKSGSTNRNGANTGWGNEGYDVVHDGTNTVNSADPQAFWRNKEDAHAGENWMSEFGGLYEKIGVSYTSEKLWFELAPKFALQDNKQNFWNGEFVGYGWDSQAAYAEANTHRGLNADDLSFAWTGLDWGVRFTPFDIVDFYWNTDVWTPGSYLPGADEHLSGGNLGSDGVAVIVKPIDGLKLAASIPMGWSMSGTPNFLDAEREDYTKDNGIREADIANHSDESVYDTDVFENYWFRVNLGAEYTLADFITVGGTITDLAHRQTRGYGLYVHANLGNIFGSLGYTYKGGAVTVDDFDGLVRIHGNHKINLAAGAAFGDLTASFEALFNLPVLGSYSIYDLYAGVKVGYDLLPNKFNVGLRVYTAMDIKHNAKYGHSNAFDLTATDGAGGSSLSSLEKAAFWYLYWGQGKWNDASEEVAKNINSGKTDKRTMLHCYGAAPMIGITPSVSYKTGRHEFNAAANLEYWLNGDGGYAVKFPVSWKWYFN